MKLKKTHLLLGIVFVLIGSYVLMQLNKSKRGYENTKNLCLNGFYLYDLNKGYEPGSILSVKTHPIFSDRIKVLNLQISREKIKNEIVKPEYIEIGDSTEISFCQVDRTENFRYNLEGENNENYVKEENLSAKVRTSFENLSSVSLKVDNGKRYGLKDGAASAIHDIINYLPIYELEKLKRVYSQEERLFFVSEVITYDNAEIVLNWSDSVESETQLEILSAIDLGGNYGWTSKDELKIKYAEESIVGFIGLFLLEEELDLINQVLESRKVKGDFVRLYLDSDGDGFGTPDMAKSVIFGEKEEPFKLFDGHKVMFVQNNLDPDDSDRNRQPGETIWYEDSDGDGYGNPDSSIKGIVCPKGYVKNNQDCYDSNPNVFPGQRKYFNNHRGDGKYDYDCDGIINKEFTSQGGCVNSCKSLRSGWEAVTPNCGQKAAYVVGCDNGSFPDYGCTVSTILKIQNCR